MGNAATCARVFGVRPNGRPIPQSEESLNRGARRGSTGGGWTLCDYGNVANSCGAEYPAIAFDFGWRTERFGIVIRELYGGFALHIRNLADQTDWVKFDAIRRITASKIIGQQSSPTGTETNATSWSPLFGVVEICSASEFIGYSVDGDSSGQRSSEICMQPEDVIDVECIRGDNQLVLRVAAMTLKPFDVFITGDVRILAVDALSGPIGGPAGRIGEKLCGSESIRQHDAKGTLVCRLP